MGKDFKDSAKEVGDKVEAAIDQGKDQVKNAENKAQDNWHDFKNEAKDKYHDLKNDAKDTMHDFKNNADSNFSSFQNKSQDFAASAEDEFNRLYGKEGKMESVVNFVRDRPILSLIVAGILGTIATKMMKCCNKKHG